MSKQVANTFIEALRALEQTGDVEPLAALAGSGSNTGASFRR